MITLAAVTSALITVGILIVGLFILDSALLVLAKKPITDRSILFNITYSISVGVICLAAGKCIWALFIGTMLICFITGFFSRKLIPVEKKLLPPMTKDEEEAWHKSRTASKELDKICDEMDKEEKKDDLVH